MKLQELLDKHKDKLWDWCDAILYEEWQIYVNYWRETVDPQTALWQFSLSDLLFSTPFLSLLEWKRNNTWTSRQMQHNKSGAMIKMANFTSPLFHKINLVLLNTDEERIKYIEQFTL